MTAHEPIQILELRQPRCLNRFGVLPCRAALKSGELRENVLLWSGAIEDAVWTKFRMTPTDGADDGPDGTATATRLRETAVSGTHIIRQAVEVEAGQEWTLSVYYLPEGCDFVWLNLPDSFFGSGSDAKFDLSTVECDRAYGSITAAPGGFYRLTLTYTATATGSAYVDFGFSDSRYAGVTATYLGDVNRGGLIWGFQAELGAEASTYLPTTDATARARWGLADTPCFNCFSTCTDRANYAPGGRIRWRFVKDRPGRFPAGDFSDPDDIATPCLPVPDLSISASKGGVNVGAVLDGKSPFGVHPTLNASGRDFQWRDQWGDFYKSDRGVSVDAPFWQLFAARNPYIGQMEAVVYDGRVGQALDDMDTRTYLVEAVSTGQGQFGISGTSPLMRVDGDTAVFPPATDVKTVGVTAIDAAVIRVTTADETNLTRVLGLGSDRFEIILGSEIIEYSGAALVEAGVYDLTVTARGVGGSAPSEHADGTAAQRVGVFDGVPVWQAAQYLLTDHTAVGGYVDTAAWEDEGNTFLSLFPTRRRVIAPRAVSELLGECCQQGLMLIWFDEYDAEIKMEAVRPPQSPPPVLTEDNAIIAGSAVNRPDPRALLTRVFVRYSPRDQTKTDETNYTGIEGALEGDLEAPHAVGEERTLIIRGDWIFSRIHAFAVMTRILARYFQVPRFLTIQVVAKDRAYRIGAVLDVATSEVLDTLGAQVLTRWQVTDWAEQRPGEVYLLDMQSYDLIGPFMFWMEDGDPDFDDATDEERAEGGWWSDDDGFMGGDAPYQWQ